MSIKEDILFDFAINMPRILVAGRTVVIDNIKKIMMLNDSHIVVLNGDKYTSVTGSDFVITYIGDERMMISGDVEEVKFFMASQEDKNRDLRT